MRIYPIFAGVFALVLCAAGGAQSASADPSSPPRNVVQLSASGAVDVQQDWLTIRLSTSKEGADAAAVQEQLKSALAEALGLAKKSAQSPAMEVRSGNFSLLPRYGKDGKISFEFEERKAAAKKPAKKAATKSKAAA